MWHMRDMVACYEIDENVARCMEIPQIMNGDRRQLAYR